MQVPRGTDQAPNRGLALINDIRAGSTGQLGSTDKASVPAQLQPQDFGFLEV